MSKYIHVNPKWNDYWVNTFDHRIRSKLYYKKLQNIHNEKQWTQCIGAITNRWFGLLAASYIIATYIASLTSTKNKEYYAR